ncbi:alpha/beta fold hydrolase [Seonamhaeicola marinus]|uniref:Proline iminopeptidase n=1 Tax=Seonamhaeicola marinus TaxID=1912246 RepID=A0A5D0HTR5_9FLAO|nr:alpha/beta fold hydrolase [Seonamhaeicola marinus]TYA74705.1 alpha/beta fold hydrolase [Seonamhaeicola marinus]
MKLIRIAILVVIGINSLKGQTKSINESSYLLIGGIEQWVTIRGNDISKPVILFLHGGPGSTMSQFENTMYGSWEDDFILVNWDQRGAGRTYGRNAPSKLDEKYIQNTPLTVDRMTRDGIELSQYLISHLKKDKIILVGTSWGSILGMEMLLKKPELFKAYLGHSQVVNPSESFKCAYEKTRELSQLAKDSVSLKKLKSLGKPPYKNARSTGQLLRIVKKYERANSTPAPNNWFKIASEYDNEIDAKSRYDGDDYSFCYFAGFEKIGIKSMVLGIDYKRSGLNIKIPIYLIQGEQDILTPKELTKPYFDSITAPLKKYILLPNAAHGHNQAVVDAQFKIAEQITHSK